MGLTTFYHDIETVRGRHQRTGTISELAGIEGGKNVQPENRFRLEGFENAFCQHLVSASGFTVRRPFFGRLENKQDLASDIGFMSSHRLGYTHQNSGMRIMTAGVHHSNLLAAEFGGLFGLGAAAVKAYPWSDARLKSNIRRIGTHPIGVGIYEYDIFGEHDVGVMAQELLSVKPEAVMRHPSGFYQVDYGRL